MDFTSLCSQISPSELIEWINDSFSIFDELTEKYGFLKYIDEITHEKPRSVLYIDDNAYRFENWISTLSFIKKQYEKL